MTPVTEATAQPAHDWKFVAKENDQIVCNEYSLSIKLTNLYKAEERALIQEQLATAVKKLVELQQACALAIDSEPDVEQSVKSHCEILEDQILVVGKRVEELRAAQVLMVQRMSKLKDIVRLLEERK